MPLLRCKNNGTKWGEKGKCYKGKNQKQKAEKQMKAIYASGYKNK